MAILEVDIILDEEPTSEILIEESVKIDVLSEGVMGPPGPPGGAVIGGYQVNIVNGIDDDVLALKNGAWINRAQTQLTDGGNF